MWFMENCKTLTLKYKWKQTNIVFPSIKLAKIKNAYSELASLGQVPHMPNFLEYKLAHPLWGGLGITY